MQINSQYKEKVTEFFRRLSDVRFAGQVVFVIIVLMISWSGVKSIQTNYSLQKQITALKQQNDLQKLQNENLALKNEYFNSNQFLELSARENFGLAKPGEKEIIVPAHVALAYTVDLPETDQKESKKSTQPTYQRNIESWLDFFLHRQKTAD